MKTYCLHLIRNGKIAASEAEKYIGHTDSPLSQEGKDELQALREKQPFPPVDAVLTSPLQRCVQTARVLYPENTALVLDGLIEYNFGEFDGKSAQELKDHPVFPAWLAGEPDAVPPFGESGQAFSARIHNCMTQVVEGLLKSGTTRCALVTHGGVIMAILAAFGLPEAPMAAWRMPAGCGYTLRVTPSLWARGKKFEVVAKLPDWES